MFGTNSPLNIITDWDLRTGWNSQGRISQIYLIITDWDLRTGWNFASASKADVIDYNRLGFAHWLELNWRDAKERQNYNRLGFAHWLEHGCG